MANKNKKTFTYN
jgi:hypothetical protein